MFSEGERLAIVGALKGVDQVFVEESLELKRHYIETHGADVLVMGDDWAGRFDEFSDICEVVYLPRTPAISTTALIEKISQAEPHPAAGQTAGGTSSMTEVPLDPSPEVHCQVSCNRIRPSSRISGTDWHVPVCRSPSRVTWWYRKSSTPAGLTSPIRWPAWMVPPW